MEHKKITYRESKPLVTIIILSADDASITLECLEALERGTRYLPVEILVVDNGSSQKQRALLKKELKQFGRFPVRYLRNQMNLGYAKANNQAAAQAQGEILIFLNNDVIVTPGWLEPLVEFMKARPRVACCQPKLRSKVQKQYFDYAGGAGGFLDMFGYPFTRGRVFDSIERDFGQYDTIREITWASGSCMAIANTVFREVGGFDEYFFSYMEEIDLCLRLKREGYRIFCVPETVVYHYGAYTSNRDLNWKIFLNHRNNLYFVFKHYSIWPYFPFLLARVLFDVFSIVYYLTELRFGFVVSVVHAHLSLLRDLPSILRRKVFTLSGKTLLVDDTVYRGSIVVAYFLLGWRNFDKLRGKSGKKRRFYKRYVDVTYFRE